jgi:hypothetical protein
MPYAGFGFKEGYAEAARHVPPFTVYFTIHWLDLGCGAAAASILNSFLTSATCIYILEIKFSLIIYCFTLTYVNFLALTYSLNSFGIFSSRDGKRNP